MPRVTIYASMHSGRVSHNAKAISSLGEFIIPTFDDEATAKDKRNFNVKGFTVKNWSIQKIKDWIEFSNKYMR